MYNSRTRSTPLPRSAARRASIFPRHPLVVQKNKNIPGWFIHVLAVSAFIPAHYIPGTTFVPHFAPLHFIPLSFQVYTSAPHSFGTLLPFHSVGSIHAVSHYPSHFLTYFQRYVFIFYSELTPMKRTRYNLNV